MIHPRTATFDENFSDETMDIHLKRCLGRIDEDQIHGRISGKSKGDQTSSGRNFFATLGKNINTNKEYSRINYTKHMMTSSLVQRVLHRGLSRK